MGGGGYSGDSPYLLKRGLEELKAIKNLDYEIAGLNTSSEAVSSLILPSFKKHNYK